MSLILDFDGFDEPINKNNRTVLKPTQPKELTAAEIMSGLWLTGNGKFPAYAELFKHFPPDWTEDEINSIFSSHTFYLRMSRRGIVWPENWTPQLHNLTKMYEGLTPQQVIAMQVVTDPTDKRSLAAKLKQVGINNTVWRAWLRNPVFAEAVRRTSEHIIQDTVAIAHTRLAQKVDQGDLGAIKTLYEVSGRHDPNKQQMLDFAKVIGLVLEVMQRHITDPVVLRAIGDDLDTVIAGEIVQPVDQMPMNLGSAEPEQVSSSPFILDL